jgi:hypothetical protein
MTRGGCNVLLNKIRPFMHDTNEAMAKVSSNACVSKTKLPNCTLPCAGWLEDIFSTFALRGEYLKLPFSLQMKHLMIVTVGVYDNKYSTGLMEYSYRWYKFVAFIV